MALICARYPDFGPSFANEKLREVHGIRVAAETLRGWMMQAQLWSPRTRKRRVVHQPRQRRRGIGELVQIDGSLHHWFEERGPRCVLLVFIDGATSRLITLRFVRTDSAFDYFDAVKNYVQNHGKPSAFYSDKHTIFRVPNSIRGALEGGQTQFGRALHHLYIEIICANTPQAKGGVELANRTLQDVHRPLLPTEILEDIFTWQELRKISRNVVVHYRGGKYHISPSPVLLHFAGKWCKVHEWVDGRIELRVNDITLPFRLFEKRQQIQAEIVENKRLGAALAITQIRQIERDKQRLISKKLTKRQKSRIFTAEQVTNPPAA